jgi:SCY1-like protein 2
MAALDVFKEVAKIADSDYLAMDVLPLLWNMSLGPLLNLQQFQSFMALIKSLSSRIESEHTRKLQELSASNSTAANRADFMSSLMPTNRVNGLDDSNGDTNDFESLVLGRNKHSTNNALDGSFDAWAQQPPATAPRPSDSRTHSGTTSPAATFSWSTPPPQTTTTLRPASTTVSRTVTPDQSLSAFAALQPSAPSHSATTGISTFNPPMHPMRPTPQSQPSTTSGTVDWSAAAGTSSASAWSTNPATTTPNYNSNPTTSSNNLWAMSSPAATNTFPQQAGASFSIAPPPRSPYSNFGVAPPPAQQPARQANTLGGGVSQQAAQNSVQNPPGQRQGIDKYESLL